MIENKKQKIIIVGGGVAGLSAGIYAQKAGFDSVIYEKHSIAGGQCTGWMREGHYIDNCICWMTCAKEGYDLWSIWKDSGICDSNIEIHQHEAFYKSELNGQTIHLWRDLDRTQKEMIALSPEDSKQIKKFIKHVKYSQCLQVPSKKPIDMMNIFELLKFGLRNLKMVPVILKYSKMSVGDLSQKFKHPLLQKIITDYFPKDYLAHLFVAAYGTICSGGGGVPVGGSFAAIQRMVSRYKNLGGKLNCSKPVSKILTNDELNNKNSADKKHKKIANGILLEDGTTDFADFVICATDTYHAFEKLIGNEYMPNVLKQCYDDQKNNPLGSSFHVAFSFDGITDKIKGRTFFDCKGFELAKRKITRMNIKNYSFEKTIAPNGKSVLQVKILENEKEYLYWKNLYETDKQAYDKEKLRSALEVQKTIEDYFDFTRGKLKVLDVWTPFTYTRFCNAYYGVYMTFMTTKKSPNISNIPGVVKNIDNLYLASQWLMMPGGIPVALITGKYAIQRILKKQKKCIKVEP